MDNYLEILQIENYEDTNVSLPEIEKDSQLNSKKNEIMKTRTTHNLDNTSGQWVIMWMWRMLKFKLRRQNLGVN